ncbi:methyl-accepting chemotaxis protein [Vibrio sp. ZSDE26]|uniref:Methyl-accepting chemotaxis protein n=1 Tax=Vibrio amylolyticus TaxID=2847292 RepID=A0A9X1XJE5_9VIBR|nr:methyl-accepting chemotaxis protein [Vibrio amylolyticus]MCK6264092.1 methyl-accepting chemotaxis protein [Vibrio amylolyticus]
MKFSTKVLALGTVISLVGLSVLTFIQYRTISQEVENTIESTIELASSQVAEVIHSELQGKRNLANYLSELLASADSQDVKGLIEQPSLRSVFVTAGIGYENDGSIIHNDSGWTAPSNWDSRSRPWYQDAKRNGSQSLTKPYVDEGTGAVLISISQPIYGNGGFIGASFFDVDLTSLATLISAVELEYATVFVVDGDGTVIAHPNSKLNGQNMSTFTNRSRIIENTELVTVQGKEYYLDFHPTKVGNWSVGILLPYEETHLPLEEMKKTVFILFLAILTLSFVIYVGAMKVLMRPLSALNEAMKNVASGDGDLTKRLDTNTDQEFKELAISFNGFVSIIQELIQGTKQTATQITEYSNVAANSAKDSEGLLHTQQQEVEQLATAMNEMSTTSSLVAQNAQSAAESAQTADTAAGEGSSIVLETTRAIQNLGDQLDDSMRAVKDLGNSIGDIESIVSVINEIADQTNLLALNAAIEAARAGESGRGFAVVADEVRTLAQRTQDSTTEIRSMIDKLQQGSQSVTKTMNTSHSLAMSTVEQAQTANHALEDIRSAISSITEMNIQIASAAEEQSLVAEEINNNTVSIKELSDKVADKASHTSEQVNKQSEHIEEQNKQLNQFIV